MHEGPPKLNDDFLFAMDWLERVSQLVAADLAGLQKDVEHIALDLSAHPVGHPAEAITHEGWIDKVWGTKEMDKERATIVSESEAIELLKKLVAEGDEHTTAELAAYQREHLEQIFGGDI